MSWRESVKAKENKRPQKALLSFGSAVHVEGPNGDELWRAGALSELQMREDRTLAARLGISRMEMAISLIARRPGRGPQWNETWCLKE
jgi:predicted NAD-dependent protein-ADP-ribosyltransferase YbiA (DUF1768 family)